MRTLALAAVLGLSAPQLHAACSDTPAPNVDWTGCSKQRPILKATLEGARFDCSIQVHHHKRNLVGASYFRRRSTWRRRNATGAPTLASLPPCGPTTGKAHRSKLEKRSCTAHPSRAALRAQSVHGDLGARIRRRRPAWRRPEIFQPRPRRLRAAQLPARLRTVHVRHRGDRPVRGERPCAGAIDVACGDAKTILPAGLKSRRRGPVEELGPGGLLHQRQQRRWHADASGQGEPRARRHLFGLARMSTTPASSYSRCCAANSAR